jgi:transposase-like protein
VAKYCPKRYQAECVSQAAQIFEFPEEIWRMIRTTNVIERCFREVRRRLKVRGCFQNSKSCGRIIYAIFNYFNTKWTRNTEKIKAIKNVTDEAA